MRWLVALGVFLWALGGVPAEAATQARWERLTERRARAAVDNYLRAEEIPASFSHTIRASPTVIHVVLWTDVGAGWSARLPCTVKLRQRVRMYDSYKQRWWPR